MVARRVYVVVCHPRADSFTAAVAATVRNAFGDREVRVSDLYADGFDPVMSAEERRTHQDPPDGKSAIAAYAENLRWCDALVFVHPTWWSGQPAMLKGWIDRVWVQGVAWTLPPGANRIRGELRNIRRIVTVTTHGSSKLINALEGEGGKRVASRALRVLCSPRARVTWLALYGVDRRGPSRRAAFLRRVDRRLRRL